MLADDPGGRKGRPGWGGVRGERCRREDEALHLLGSDEANNQDVATGDVE